MDANNYQFAASRTLLAEPDAVYTSGELMLVWNAIGLAGETGEVNDIIKKVVFHRHEFDEATRNKLIEELGDVLWYVAALCSKLDVTMSHVMRQNIAKLQTRYKNGYTSAESINRQPE